MELYKVKLQMIKDKTINTNDKIKKPIDIVNYINSIENYSMATTETLIVVALNTKNEIVAYSEIAHGGSNNCELNIPSIFKIVFMSNASKFILAHNHPSGDSTPSKADIDVTKKVLTASLIMGIDFVDHIVIGDNNYHSIMSDHQELCSKTNV